MSYHWIIPEIAPLVKVSFLDYIELFFSLFVFCGNSAPLTVLLEFNFAFDQLLVFAGPIISAGAFRTGQLYELILGHVGKL